MRVIGLIAILALLSPLAGDCCGHGVEVFAAASSARAELHADHDCDCGDEHHDAHEDCRCLCHLSAAPPVIRDIAGAMIQTGEVEDLSCAAARHLSVTRDRPPILA